MSSARRQAVLADVVGMPRHASGRLCNGLAQPGEVLQQGLGVDVVDEGVVTLGHQAQAQ